jgi:DNA primase
VLYPSSFITRVKTHFRLSEVIGKRISIRKNGREFQACCPFHNEKTPSFTINDEKNFYHCFGCGQHGDALSFVMEYERLNYREAIETLAREAGLALPVPDAASQQRYDKEDRVLSLLDAACEWFRGQLHSSVGHAARRYLSERGIQDTIIAEFDIGYAPQSREGLKLAMLEKGYSEQQLLDAGLLIKVDNTPSYDRFRGRVMFPIRRLDNKVIAFGGRLLEASEHSPKYLNSPETLVFKKHEVLFNMNKVRSIAHNAPSIIVVEGYTDVIALHAHGVPYAVAPLGTAFGEAHLQQLWRFHANPILCFDGDKAGQKAMLRAADIAMPHVTADRLLRFCGLPKGEDPDSYVRSNGADVFEAMASRALSLSELLWNVYIGRKEFNTPELLAMAERKLMNALAALKDEGLKHRIEASFKNRLWHMQRDALKHVEKRQAQMRHAGLNLSSKARNPVTLQLEQIFALVVRFPALLQEEDVEHFFCTWDWSDTMYQPCVSALIMRSHEVTHCRYVLSEFLHREFPAADIRLQEHYNKGVIPADLYGKDEVEGLESARHVFTRLKQKIEQHQLTGEMRSMVKHYATIANDEGGDERLLELIKMQQNAYALAQQQKDDSYS